MRREKGLFLAVLGMVLLAPFACGKKGPPFLPEASPPLKVEQLKGDRENGTVVLKGRVVAREGQKKDKSDITGCRVYHAWYALENPPCEGCPIRYGAPKEIKGEVVTSGGLHCEIPWVKKKGIHFFEVRLIGRNGAIGPPSNRAKLTIDY